jgi:hypothetical protein
MRRLERIEALKSSQAPAGEVLGELRRLLAEGEAWLAAEGGGNGGSQASAGRGATEDAAAALADCRARLGRRGEVVPEAAGSRDL